MASVSVSPSSGVVGTTITVTGTAWGSKQRVAVKFDGTTLGNVRSASDGTFTFSGTVPSATISTHVISGTVSRGQTVITTASASFSVTGSPPASTYLVASGQTLLLNGSTFHLYGASTYGGLDNPSQSCSDAVTAKLNTIRITNWLHEEAGQNPYEEARWVLVDGLIAQARTSSLKVILDLSTYRNFLFNSKLNPYIQDWSTFISFVANRVNTVNGQTYKTDTTIGMVGFAGEVDGITGNPDPRCPTTAQLSTFFQTVFGQWRALDANHLLQPGGLFHLNGDSGIDWRTIFSYADVAAIHNYSTEDSTNTAVVAAYCASINKPWITEEFGFPQSIADVTRAADYQTIYTLQTTNSAAGVAFWNLGRQILGVNGVTDTYDVNTSTPLTYAKVTANAP